MHSPLSADTTDRTDAHKGRVVAVVTTHNRMEQLQTTLARLLAVQSNLLSAIVVVDNLSTDGTRDWLRREEARIGARLQVLLPDHNLGGAGGFEIGMRHARAQLNPDWCLLMDDDARPDADALAQFHRRDHSGWDVIAAAVYFPNRQICEMNRPSQNPFQHPRLFLRTLMGHGRDGYHISRGAYAGDEIVPLDITSFVGFFVSRAAMDKVGEPDGRLFLYGDDVLYALSLRKAGMTIGFDPKVTFEHDCTTYSNENRRVFRPLWKVYYTYRNGLLMYQQAAGWLFWPLMPLLTVKWLLAAKRYGAARRDYLRLLRMALRDGILRRTTTRHEDILAAAGPPKLLPETPEATPSRTNQSDTNVASGDRRGT